MIHLCFDTLSEEERKRSFQVEVIYMDTGFYYQLDSKERENNVEIIQEIVKQYEGKLEEDSQKKDIL
jgi:hypothetical protein